VFKYLIEEIKKMEGVIISIGVDDKLINALKRNKKINAFDISKSERISFFQRKKRTLSSTGKRINIKKLRKYFKKHSVENIICDYEQITKYYKYIFKDSIFLTKGKIYFYANKDVDMEYILKYKRYGSEITIKDYDRTKLIIIDNENAKTNKFKNVCFMISDTVNNFIDFISNVIVG